MNRIELVGRIVWSVELRRDHSTQQTVGDAMLAVWSDGTELEFIPVTLHGRDAEDAATYLGLGSQIEVHGHMHSALVVDRGKGSSRRMRRVMEVIADRVTYIDVCPPVEDEQQ